VWTFDINRLLTRRYHSTVVLAAVADLTKFTEYWWSSPSTSSFDRLIGLAIQ
jgi:hypothetical protein